MLKCIIFIENKQKKKITTNKSKQNKKKKLNEVMQKKQNELMRTIWSNETKWLQTILKNSKKKMIETMCEEGNEYRNYKLLDFKEKNNKKTKIKHKFKLYATNIV